MKKFKSILENLPYSKPFLFVDTLESINEYTLEGSYTFLKDEYFYKGHFIENPVTPGVILTECMAQIGLVCFGIFLLDGKFSSTEKLEEIKPKIALASHSVDFYIPVFPGETVRVVSEKVYFRFNKLKCNVRMFNEKNEVVCKGILSGMIYSTLQKKYGSDLR